MALRVKIIATDKLSGTLLRVGKNVARVGVRFAKMGVLAAGVISVIAIKLQKDMERGLREIGTLMGGLTDNEMKNMGRELEILASKSGQAMNKLTKARYDIVSAGFTGIADSLHLLNTAADLAIGGVSDVAATADLLTTVMNSYNFTIDRTVEISDKLFTIVRLGKTTITELAASMGRLVAISGTLNISFDEIGAAVAVLTASGQKSEEAMTAIRSALVELKKPSEDLLKVINALGFENSNALLSALGFADSIGAIASAADQLGIPIDELIGNIRTMQALLPLTGIQAEKFADGIREIKDASGATEKAVEEMRKTFDFTVQKMKRNVENILRSLGGELIAKLKPKIDKFNETIERMGLIDWGRLANVMTENWKVILEALLVFGGDVGKLIGKKLGKTILEGLKATFPNITKFFDEAFMTSQERVEKIAAEMAEALQKKQNVDWWLDIIPDESFFKEGAKNVETFGEAWDKLGESLVFIESAFTKVKDVSDETFADFMKKTLENLEEFPDLAKEAAEKFDWAVFIPDPKLSDEWFEFWDKVKSDAENAFNETLNTVQQFADAVGDIHDNFLDLRKAQIQSELEAQIGAVLASGLAEEEKQAKISNLRDKARQDEIKAAKALKPIQIAQAISYTALGVIKAWSDPGGVAGVILSAFIAAAGAAEIATIAAQPYAHGGFVRGNIPASDTIPAMLTPNEIVSTSAASERFGAEISRLNQLAEGGFGTSGGDTFIIYALDSQSFADAIKRNPKQFAEAMQLTKSERYL